MDSGTVECGIKNGVLKIPKEFLTVEYLRNHSKLPFENDEYTLEIKLSRKGTDNTVINNIYNELLNTNNNLNKLINYSTQFIGTDLLIIFQLIWIYKFVFNLEAIVVLDRKSVV